MTGTPLCVDLDGTLTASDLSWESLLASFRAAPLATLRIVQGHWGDPAAMKHALAQGIDLDVEQLPLHEDLIAQLRQEAAHRPLVLATGSHQRYAEALAARTGLFRQVFATRADFNCTGRHKAGALVEQFGEGGFDYIGNSQADLPVWKHAREAWVWSADTRLIERARAVNGETRVLAPPALRGGELLRLLRPHQWLKNLLVFLPLLAGHVLQSGNWMLAAVAFVCFCCVASAGYIFNDLLDVQSDRRHASKRRRPLATGSIGIRPALLTALALALGGFLFATLLGGAFFAALLVYFAGTLAYSLILKRHAPVDVFVLSGLYTLRIFAGGLAAGVPASSWLLTFSVFVFLSLALVKRHTELLTQAEAADPLLSGRGWRREDLSFVRSMGLASALGSALVLAIYLHSPASLALYAHPEWLVPAIATTLLWLTHLWLSSVRGRMHDDPVIFALRDPLSLFWIGATMTVALLAK